MKDEPNTLEAEATSLPMIPTQSRLSANDTTPHLRKQTTINAPLLASTEVGARNTCLLISP